MGESHLNAQRRTTTTTRRTSKRRRRTRTRKRRMRRWRQKNPSVFSHPKCSESKIKILMNYCKKNSQSSEKNCPKGKSYSFNNRQSSQAAEYSCKSLPCYHVACLRQLRPKHHEGACTNQAVQGEHPQGSHCRVCGVQGRRECCDWIREDLRHTSHV